MIKIKTTSFAFLAKVTASLSLFLFLFNACQNKSKRFLKNEDYFDEILVKTLENKVNIGHQKAYAILDSIHENDPKVNLLFDFMYYRFYAGEYFGMGKIDVSKKYAEKLLPILNQIGTPETLPAQYSLAYFTLSDIYYSQQEYLQAYKYLYLGKNTPGSNSLSLSEYNYRIGMILYKQQEYKLAAKSFIDAVSHGLNDKTFEQIYRQQEILSNIGLSYYKANQPDSAIHWYHKALDYLAKKRALIHDTTQFKGAEGVVLGNLGQVYASKGNFDKAISLLKQSIKINDQSIFLHEDASLQKIHLAEVYLQQDSFEKFNSLFPEIENYFKNKPISKANSDILKLKSAYHSKRKDYEKALSYLKEANALDLKIKNDDRKLTNINIVEQLQIIENKNKLELLKKETEVKNIYLISAIALFCLILIILILIIQYWAKSKKTVKTLNSLNKTINQQSQELKVKNLEKDKLMKVVAHDLRNPIGSIISITKLLQHEDDINNENQKLINMAEVAATDSLTLISDILENHNKEESTLFKKPYHINEILTQTYNLLKIKTEEKNQELKLSLNETNAVININREQIVRVLNNLITNASKFSDLNSNIEIKSYIADSMAVITITDEGIGIDNGFVSVSDLTSNKKEGTLGEKSFGMGLDICKKIIEEHDGAMGFESNKNKKGTTFFIKIPIHHI